MPNRRAAVSARRYRHRRQASRWLARIQSSPLTHLAPLVQFASRQPSRAVLHLAVLSIGLVGVVAGLALNPPTGAPIEQVIGVDDEFDPEQGLEISAAPSETSAPPVQSYVVKDGDTLNRIADRFGVTVATIAAASDLDDPDEIVVGDELRVPSVSGVLYNLAGGETLGQIANKFGVDPSQIAQVNRLMVGVGQIVAGQSVLIPGIEPELKVSPTRRPAQPGGGRPAPPSPVSYVVQDGDTIGSVAEKFGVSARTLLVANNLSDPDMLKVGLKLRVLPVSGVEHEVDDGESLADIAAAYKVDLGPIVDFNGLRDPDVLRVGDKLIIPGATARVVVPVAAPVIVAAAPAARLAAQTGGALAGPAGLPSSGRSAPAIQAAIVGGGGNGVVRNAMNFLGYRYVFGGTTPAGFDCSGFVYYVHRISGDNVSRGLWGQMNGGPRVARENLVPGDTVFFANTYMPGLSHVGIYIGGGRFIHAIDESQGVGISSLGEAYWSSRYVGATRLW